MGRKKVIVLQPVDMTTQIMEELEKRKLIIRLCPAHHDLAAKKEETLDKTLYVSDKIYGTHKLISVTVNRTAFAAFGAHPDNEEFLLIGNPDTKPLYLVIALHLKEALQDKIGRCALSADDFVCLRIKYNDPQVSFFTMLAGVPHGEAVADAGGKAPSFYVTEPANMGIDLTDFGQYSLSVEGSICISAIVIPELKKLEEIKEGV